MASIRKPPQFVKTLADALTRILTKQGLNPRVSFEAVPRTKLYRFVVVSPAFEKMPYSERQEIVWRVVQTMLPVEDQFLVGGISTIEPFAEDEAA